LPQIESHMAINSEARHNMANYPWISKEDLAELRKWLNDTNNAYRKILKSSW
jgi:hypothetical protein